MLRTLDTCHLAVSCEILKTKVFSFISGKGPLMDALGFQYWLKCDATVLIQGRLPLVVNVCLCLLSFARESVGCRHEPTVTQQWHSDFANSEKILHHRPHGKLKMFFRAFQAISSSPLFLHVFLHCCVYSMDMNAWS